MAFTALTPDEAMATEEVSPFAFLLPSGTLILANDRTGICEAIIEGYDSLEADEEDSDPWLSARFHDLAAAVAASQLALMNEAYEKHPGLAETLTEDQLTALLHPKDEETLIFDGWPVEEIPLIMMSVNYAPYTKTPPPDSDNIIWVNPHTERTYLDALEKLGYGTLYINQEALAAHEREREELQMEPVEDF